MAISALFYLLLLIFSAALVACGGASGPPLPGGVTPNAPADLKYEGAITLGVTTGSNVPGTTIIYQGKTADGRAILNIAGLQSLKSTADSLDWAGPIGAGAQANLGLRVVTFDDSNLALAGTIRLIIPGVNPQPGNPSSNLIAGYTIPTTYNVPRGTTIPGSVVQFVGSTPQGAQFTNLDQFPYRQRFDSVIWQGHLRDKIAVRLDLRLINFGDDSALLGGTARVMFEQ